MTENALSRLAERAIEVWNNKLISLTVASGYTITATVSASDKPPATFKTLADIPISEMFSHDLSAQAAFGIVGGLYIFIKLLEAIKAFSFIAWAYRRFTGAK